MTRRLALFWILVLLLSACGLSDESAEPKFGTWGVDTDDMDTTVRPGDNFFDYTLGLWIKAAQIPPDRTYVGVDQVINDQVIEDLKAIIEQSVAANAAEGEITQKIADFYTSYMDEETLDAKGIEPLKPDLAAIDAITTKDAMAAPLAALNIAGADNPFPVGIGIDPKTPTRYLPQMWQGGLSFGERDYYLDPDLEDLRAKFVTHVENTLKLAGYPDARAQAEQILALETKMAEAQWPLEEARNDTKTSNIMPRADVEKLAAGAPLAAILDRQRLPADGDYQVGMPDVLTKTARLFADEPLDAWKAYLRYHLIAHYGNFLAKPFSDEMFNFYSRELSGRQERTPRWKEAVRLVSGDLGDAVGQLYVAERFPATTRDQALAMVENLREAYAARIESADWMAPETKASAQAKLAALVPKIGYPDKWRSFDSVTISDNDLIANVKSAEAWWDNDALSKLGKPIDRTQWSMTPQTNNAYYSSQLNDIVFTAAILQPPHFDPAADPAANYGAIGATIGHEMSHAFDDQGRKTDSTGALRDWWTPADAQRYDDEAARLIAQFDTYEPLPGIHIDGAATVGENIADLAGLRVAYDAYKLSLNGEEAPVIDGLTGDQRFFIAYAANWKAVYREEMLRNLLLSDVHSPDEYRVNGIVRNMDEWYAAFEVKEGDALYLRPEDRVQIW